MRMAIMRMARGRLWAVAGVAVASLTLAGCAKSTSVDGSGSLNGGAPSVAPSVPKGSGGSGDGSPGAKGSNGSTAKKTGTTTARHTTATNTNTTANPNGPRIVSFEVVEQPSCPVTASSDAPFSSPAKDVKIAWEVSGATKVALSIDDPTFFKQHGSGTYAEYSWHETVSLAFSCEGSDQYVSHTYTIDTVDGGPTAERSITVRALRQP
jgi:hypothetical protein